jgi:hypothetical protein
MSTRRFPRRRGLGNGSARARCAMVHGACEQLERRTLLSAILQTGAATTSDNGGPLITTPNVVLILWGAGWGGAQTPSIGTVQNAANVALSDRYLGDLRSYWPTFGGGSIYGTYTITSSSPAANFTNAQVRTMITNNINAGVLPRPTAAGNLLYMCVTQSGSTDPAEGLGGEHTYAFDNLNNLFHYGWTINDGNIDTVSTVFSHELVEAMTDPEGNSIQVNPRNASSWNEICDGTAQSYAARINNVKLQSYWLQSKNAYVIGTGAQSFSNVGGHLVVNGDQLANKSDTIIIDSDAYGGVSVNMNGEVTSLLVGTVSDINVSGLTAADALRIEYNAGAPTTVSGGDGDDFLDLSFYSRNLDRITGSVTEFGGAGNDGLWAYDNSNGFVNTYTITSARFDRPFWGGFFYGGDIEGLTLTTDAFADTVNVTSTFAGQPDYLNSAGGADTVNIGGTNGLQSIAADVQVNNSPSFTTLNINDGPDGSAHNAVVDISGSYGYITGLAPANIFWNNSDISSVNITTGSQPDTVSVNRNLRALSFSSTGGLDTVNLGNASTGTQEIGSTITITNPPSFTTVNVNDGPDATARTVTQDTVSIGGFNYGQITGIAPGTILYKYNDTLAVNVTTGTGIDTVNVLRNGATTNLSTTGGGDVVNVGNSLEGVQSIFGNLTMTNPPSFDTINVNDTADTTARTVTHNTVTIAAFPYGQIVGLAPAAIQYRYNDTSAVNLTTGTAADTVNVLASGASLFLNSAGGGDAVNVGNPTNGMQSILGYLNIQNAPSFTQLTLNDSADTVGRVITHTTTVISGVTFGRVTGMAPATIDYNGFDVQYPVTLLGGSGGNTFNVSATTFAPLAINPGTGTDTVTLNNTSSAVTILASTGFDNVNVNNLGVGTAQAIFNSSIDLNSLTVGPGGTVSLLAGGNKLLYTHTLAVTGNGTVDLADNAAIVDYTGASPIASIKTLLTNGYNGANWNGVGVNSSVAAANVGHHTALGYAEAADIGSPATFRGHAVDNTSVLISYAYYGDANLDKTVGLTDFTFLAANFNGVGKGWSRGNFNYDAAGTVDLTDFTLLAANFNSTLPGGDAVPAQAISPTSIVPNDKVIDEVATLPSSKAPSSKLVVDEVAFLTPTVPTSKVVDDGAVTSPAPTVVTGTRVVGQATPAVAKDA